MTALERARAALERGDFAGALAELDGLPQAEESPEVLEARGHAAYGAGDLEAAIGSWERLYAVHVAADRTVEAAYAAALVALNLLCETGLMAPVRGWVGRAERLVGDDEPGPVHALLAITRTYERILCGDPEGALGPAREAVELGTAYGVDPARGLGRVALARLAIHRGDLGEGIAMLDDLAVDLGAGQFDTLTTGNVWCELICVAQWIGRHDLAREWTEVMDRWRRGPVFGAIHGRCRVHRAELLRVSGPGDAAEEEALGACEELRPWMRREYGWPLVELGNIRLRRGDLAGAEEAFLDAHRRAWSPQPGLALVRLAQGDVDTAASMVRGELEHPSDVPWKERPPFGALRVVPLLAAQSEIAAAADDQVVAEAAAEGLGAVLERYPSTGLRAETRLAVARAALLAGAPETAVREAWAAAAAWVDQEAPYDAANARVVLGEAHLALGNPEAARMEWTAARAAFEQFGAELRAVEVDRRIAELDGGGAGTVPDEAAAPEQAKDAVAELLAQGDHRVLRYGGAEVVLPDLKGLAYLARLLAEPGREFHAVELAGSGAPRQAGLPVIDDEAKAAYRRRLEEVERDIDEAVLDGDLARQQLAERDKEYLVAELARAVGLGGRSRTTGDTGERARTAVTRSRRYALARVTPAPPGLGRHLDRAVRTGTYCSYVPDPLAPISWRVG